MRGGAVCGWVHISQHTWMSEDNLWSWVSLFTFMWVLRIKLTLPSLHDKCLYPLWSHITGVWVIFIAYCCIVWEEGCNKVPMWPQKGHQEQAQSLLHRETNLFTLVERLSGFMTWNIMNMTVTWHSRNGNIHLFMLKNHLGWNLGYSNLRIHLYQLLFCDKLPKKKKIKSQLKGKRA